MKTKTEKKPLAATDEFDKAVSDLEGILAKGAETEKPKTPAEEAEAAAAALAKGEGDAAPPFVAKDKKDESDGDEGEDDDETEDDETEDEDGKSLATQVRDGIFKAMAEDGSTVELLDASRALRHMASVVGKSFGDVIALQQGHEAVLGEVIAEQGKLRKALVVILRGQAELLKAFGERAVKPTAAGIVGTMGGKPVSAAADAGGGTKQARGITRLRLIKAVREEKIDPEVLSRFEVVGERALVGVSAEVLKSYDIPIPAAN